MSEYLKQAEDFLTATGTEFKIEYLRTGPYFKDDKESRDIYRFTLSNAKGSYSHEFGDSTRNTERRIYAATKQPLFSFKHDARTAKALGFNTSSDDKFKAELIAARNHKPSAYDILAGMGHYVEPIFEEWAAELGYNDAPMADYPKIRAIHDDCLRESAALSRMFTAEQLEQLQEIN